MTTVKQLVDELKTMPQHLDVGVAMHDNEEGEISHGWVTVVYEMINDLDPKNETKCVCIHAGNRGRDMFLIG